MNTHKDATNSPGNTTNSPTKGESKENGDEAAQLKKLQRLVRRKKDSPFPHITHPRKRAYLTALAETGMKGRAAALAGVSKRTPNTAQWKNDPEFQAALQLAVQMGYDALEAEAERRAVEGVRKPAGWYKGEPGGYVQEYSDNLLMFLLKAGRPEKYADRHDIRSSHTVNILVVKDLMSRRELPQTVIRRLADGENVDAVMLSWAADLRNEGQPVPAGLLGSGDGPGG